MHNKVKNAIGYVILFGILLGLYALYNARPLVTPSLMNLVFLSGAASIIVMTVSVFWLWKEARVEQLENIFGILGHIPHCGYCFSLWLAAFGVGIFGINLVPIIELHTLISFLLSWWGLAFVNVLFFEILSVLWFKKVASEFTLRDLYERSQTHQH